MTRYYVDQSGNYIGGFDGTPPPAGAVEVPSAPTHGADKWGGGIWVPHPAPTAAQKEAEALNALADVPVTTPRPSILRLAKSMLISVECYRLGVTPANMTPAQFNAASARIANIYKSDLW